MTPTPIAFNIIRISVPIALGNGVSRDHFEAKQNGTWNTVPRTSGKTLHSVDSASDDLSFRP